MKKLIIPLSFILLGLTPIKTTDVKDIQSISNKNFQDIDTKQKVYNDNITYGYFHDRGTVNVADYTLATLTENGTWQTLDLSAIIPVGTKAILFHIEYKDAVAGSFFYLRKNGFSGAFDYGALACPIANGTVSSQLIIPCDANRVIQYNIPATAASPGTNLVIKGWWK